MVEVIGFLFVRLVDKLISFNLGLLVFHSGLFFRCCWVCKKEPARAQSRSLLELGACSSSKFGAWSLLELKVKALKLFSIFRQKNLMIHAFSDFA